MNDACAASRRAGTWLVSLSRPLRRTSPAAEASGEDGGWKVSGNHWRWSRGTNVRIDSVAVATSVLRQWHSGRVVRQSRVRIAPARCHVSCSSRGGSLGVEHCDCYRRGQRIGVVAVLHYELQRHIAVHCPPPQHPVCAAA